MHDSASRLATYFGPLMITLGYVGAYYAMIVNGLTVRTKLAKEYRARNERFDRYSTPDKRMLAADRVQLNTLEHMPPFLVLLWLDATLVSTQHATIGGAVYLAVRCIYPFAVGRTIGGGPPVRVMPFTFIGYATLAFFAVDLVWAIVSG